MEKRKSKAMKKSKSIRKFMIPENNNEDLKLLLQTRTLYKKD